MGYTGPTTARFASSGPMVSRSALGLTVHRPAGLRMAPGISSTSEEIKASGWQRRLTWRNGPTSKTSQYLPGDRASMIHARWH